MVLVKHEVVLQEDADKRQKNAELQQIDKYFGSESAGIKEFLLSKFAGFSLESVLSTGMSFGEISLKGQIRR